MTLRATTTAALSAATIALLTGCLDPRLAAELAQRQHDEDLQEEITPEEPTDDDDDVPVEDTQAPQLVSAEPDSNANSVRIESGVRVTFDEELDGSSAAGLRLHGPYGEVAGNAWVDGAELHFDPSHELEGSQQYQVVVSGVSDLAGNVAADASWLFRVEATPNWQATVVAVEVAQGQWHHFGPFEATGGTFHVDMMGEGDADLYVRVGDHPTDEAFDCRPYIDGSDENCALEATGPIYVSVKGFVDAQAEVYVEWTGWAGFAGMGRVEHQEMDVIGLLVRAGETIRIDTTSATDLDLYISWNDVLSISSYDDASTSSSGEESLTFTAPEEGVLEVGLYGYAAADYSVHISSM